MPTKPLLAVDVDGVISLFGFDQLPESLPVQFEMFDGVAHCISRSAGDRLKLLAEYYELVWATGWEGRVNRLATLLDIPECPYLTFDGKARFGSADWKLGPLEEYAMDRPLAWIDDCFDESCRRWAADRGQPTLLVPVRPALGLEQGHFEKLVEWARALRLGS